MKTILYLECNMGAAGDMLTAALLELHPNPQDFLQRLSQIGLPHVQFTAQSVQKCGITGTHMNVTIDGEQEHSEDMDLHHSVHAEHPHESHHHGHTHHHSVLHDIEHIVSHLDIPNCVRADILAVYHLIAEAESKAHNKPIEQIHFHEVGTLDAIADVTAVCMLLHELAPEQIVCSPVHVGCGMVKCAHGILPVPAPATAYLLREIPTYGGAIQGELCTPTGAALLKHFVNAFGSQPVMCIHKIGYGMGTKDFPAANCVRASLGETQEHADDVLELCCNLDDMTAEAIGFAMDRLLEAGALDVYTTPIGMKKCRPATLLTCLCRPEQRNAMLPLLFQHTTTIGVRERICSRYTLDRDVISTETLYGTVRIKVSSGWGTFRKKAEYDDLRRIAEQRNISLEQADDLLNY